MLADEGLWTAAWYCSLRTRAHVSFSQARHTGGQSRNLVQGSILSRTRSILVIQQAWFVGIEAAAVILYAGACRLCRTQSGSVMLGAFEDSVSPYAFRYISVWWVLNVSFSTHIDINISGATSWARGNEQQVGDWAECWDGRRSAAFQGQRAHRRAQSSATNIPRACQHLGCAVVLRRPRRLTLFGRPG